MKCSVFIKFFIICWLSFIIYDLSAQQQTTATPSRSLTMEEYEKAKTFNIKDLNKDTYVKFDNMYVLDRYESKKPYFITGDDSLKKRLDIYKLLAKDGMQELGVMLFYTNEKGVLYKAVLPGLSADGKVWERYFEDIHAIDKTEKNFVLKLSYVLSRELSFQLYKAQGKEVSKEEGTYGTDICFPGDNEVEMADGSVKALRDILEGDQVSTIDPVTKIKHVARVQSLSIHTEKNYAITEMTLISASNVEYKNGIHTRLSSKQLKATPNHPVTTNAGIKNAGAVQVGEQVFCLDEHTGTYKPFTVWHTREYAGGVQKVYNIVADAGDTFIMNSVMVMQKATQ
ncbi:MAG: hypothetical protein V4717_12680 [Bacteroidota bacterium]